MKPTARVCAVAAALLAAGAIAAGCGNGEQNDYVDQVNQIQTQLVSDISDVGNGASATNPTEAAAVANEMAQVFTNSADDLEAVDPPDDVADLHQQLVEQLRSVGEKVKKAGDAFTNGTPQEMQQAALELQQAATEAQTQLNSLVDQINSQLQS